jgi:hypothetical protein
MCASFEANGKQWRPGRVIGVWNGGKAERAVWSGFARGEILSWWMDKGCTPVDVPAVRFAERSRKEGRLIWGEMPPGMVIRGLWDASGEAPQILIVTRQATSGEEDVFGHERMPMLAAPIYSAELLPVPPEVVEPQKDSGQLELF